MLQESPSRAMSRTLRKLVISRWGASAPPFNERTMCGDAAERSQKEQSMSLLSEDEDVLCSSPLLSLFPPPLRSLEGESP